MNTIIQKSIVRTTSRPFLSIALNRIVSGCLPYSTPSEPAESCGTKAVKNKRVKTPIGKLDELEEGQHPYQEKEPLKPWPNQTNPNTGEIGGPKGPEPTRYGDWERKGRVTDF